MQSAKMKEMEARRQFNYQFSVLGQSVHHHIPGHAPNLRSIPTERKREYIYGCVCLCEGTTDFIMGFFKFCRDKLFKMHLPKESLALVWS